MLKPDERNKIIEDIECEGFCYNFIDYTSYKEIKDEKFHELRKKFVESAHELADYLYYIL